MNPEVLSAAAGVLLSLAFSYLPGLNGWFSSLDGTHKRLVMLAALVLVGCRRLCAELRRRWRAAEQPAGVLAERRPRLAAEPAAGAGRQPGRLPDQPAPGVSARFLGMRSFAPHPQEKVFIGICGFAAGEQEHG